MGAHPHGAWILLHLLLFVFWLGGDLGVYVSSRYVLRPDLPFAARSTALSIMGGLDLGPKICLVLTLPSGVTLMALEPHGAGHLLNGWSAGATWLFAALWLWLTVREHHHPGRHPWTRRADWTLRVLLTAVLWGVGLYTLLAAEPFGVDTDPRWLGGKVLLYATAIACGLGIRLTLRPFAGAFGALARSGSGERVERELRRAVDGCVPYVAGIWACVLAAAALGVFKPGADL
ncbi:hypothetical protein EAO71_36080 [Streptomyces sp. ms191]|uniref:hypothetical protein n=1 Tax=Streptomyces sp. ms191 TaxID=1827978 RepID=UPI0011CDDF62|nr:hypothetical protein [Streptomyces sp. ms191]TXS12921.1 hypothetical protein EAO71_36080 [Streptomyces sp. ms191]